MTYRPPRLGPGAIYLRSLDELFRSHGDLIKVAEIEPQSLWMKPTAPGALPRGSPGELRQLQALPQSVLMHGVGCPIGGTICDEEQQAQFRSWTEALHAPWTSEHLSVFYVHGARGEQPCGFLMPPLQTEGSVRLAAANIRRRSALVGKPFAFETGVNYFAPRNWEMPDGEFFANIAETADCGILLDLTNLWANHKNGRADIHELLQCLPLERVWEVHLAGLEYAHGHWLDAHAKGIDQEILDIAFDVVGDLPNLGAIIFEIAPDRLPVFRPNQVMAEIEKIALLWSKTRNASREGPRPSRTTPARGAPEPEAWERLIADQLLPAGERPVDMGRPFAMRAEDQRTFSLYRRLVRSFRRGAVAELMENTARLLLLSLGEGELRRLMERYLEATPPCAFPTDEALSFQRFLQKSSLGVPGLEDISKFEAALVAAAANGEPVQVEVGRELDGMLAEIAAGRLPVAETEESGTTLEIRVDPVPEIRVVS